MGGRARPVKHPPTVTPGMLLVTTLPALAILRKKKYGIEEGSSKLDHEMQCFDIIKTETTDRQSAYLAPFRIACGLIAS